MMLVFGIPLLLLLVLSLASGIVMIVGGLKMLRLESYGWALAACVIAVLPINPVGMLGLIVGIWGLVVLNQPSVRVAFRGSSAVVEQRDRAWLLWVVISVICLAIVIGLPFGAILLYWLGHF
jgi:hypothetical protein